MLHPRAFKITVAVSAQSGHPYSNIHSGQVKGFALANVRSTEVFDKKDNNICIRDAEENDLSKSPPHKGRSQSPSFLETPKSSARSRVRTEKILKAQLVCLGHTEKLPSCALTHGYS